jgi:hypothetical protein
VSWCVIVCRTLSQCVASTVVQQTGLWRDKEVKQKRRRSDAEQLKVTQSDAEVTQVGLQINGLRGLRRIASHANIFAAKRSRQLRQAEKEESRDWGKSTGWGRVLPDTVG